MGHLSPPPKAASNVIGPTSHLPSKSLIQKQMDIWLIPRKSTLFNVVTVYQGIKSSRCEGACMERLPCVSHCHTVTQQLEACRLPGPAPEFLVHWICAAPPPPPKLPFWQASRWSLCYWPQTTLGIARFKGTSLGLCFSNFNILQCRFQLSK